VRRGRVDLVEQRNREVGVGEALAEHAVAAGRPRAGALAAASKAIGLVSVSQSTGVSAGGSGRRATVCWSANGRCSAAGRVHDAGVCGELEVGRRADEEEPRDARPGEAGEAPVGRPRRRRRAGRPGGRATRWPRRGGGGGDDGDGDGGDGDCGDGDGDGIGGVRGDDAHRWGGGPGGGEILAAVVISRLQSGPWRFGELGGASARQALPPRARRPRCRRSR
jgi:hypothetical protein